MSFEKRKYIILVGDGMGDYPQEALDGKTTLEAAHTPHMDKTASQGIMGWAQTVPSACEPGSDIANLSLMGYDPLIYHTGRAPLEAVSMGIRLKDKDVAFRCNLVCLDHQGSDAVVMGSYSAGHISTEEARILINDLNGFLAQPELSFYPGVSYRHILVWAGADPSAKTKPPHDLTGQDVTAYLNSKGELGPIVDLIRRTWPFLSRHPINQNRLERGLVPANSIWLWGQGKPPSMPSFRKRFGLRGGVISAVDLLKGIGLSAGLESLFVEGMTGYLDTNFRGKAEKALAFLAEKDLVYVHVEAPDEASHEGSLEKKIQAIEAFDREVVGPVLTGLNRFEAYSLMIVTDHFTPIQVMTHTREPVPFSIFCSEDQRRPSRKRGFSERAALEGEVSFLKGDRLMPWFLQAYQG
ncbi:MAG: cofactor-independent phosphoglycerate mutase [Thermodesulfobacteriota bacterium]|jgi:2,3-bisphosphoglycerate-independent phosphoglycerate mutase